MMSEKVWAKLTDQQKAWLQKAVELTEPFQKELWATETQVALDALQAAGINIITPDKTPFQESVVDFKRSFAGTPVGDILDRIEEKRWALLIPS